VKISVQLSPCFLSTPRPEPILTDPLQRRSTQKTPPFAPIHSAYNKTLLVDRVNEFMCGTLVIMRRLRPAGFIPPTCLMSAGVFQGSIGFQKGRPAPARSLRPPEGYPSLHRRRWRRRPRRRSVLPVIGTHLHPVILRRYRCLRSVTGEQPVPSSAPEALWQPTIHRWLSNLPHLSDTCGHHSFIVSTRALETSECEGNWNNIFPRIIVALLLPAFVTAEYGDMSHPNARWEHQISVNGCAHRPMFLLKYGASGVDGPETATGEDGPESTRPEMTAVRVSGALSQRTVCRQYP
jgi:hypothetical protein